MLNQKQSKKSIIVRKSKATDEIAVIQFPFSLIIENKSLSKNEFGSIDYEYGYNDKGANIILIDNGEKISNYQLKVVPPKEKQTYLIYSVHFIDYSETTQNQLKPYVQKMLELDQDTLHVGTVAEFKEHHPELFKMLTENDTISIRHLKGRNSGLGERVAIPANW